MGPAGPELLRLPLEIDALAFFHRGDFLRRDAAAPDHLVVADSDAALADGPHGEFRLVGHTKLADDDDIKRRLERLGHLVCDGNAAPRQAQHDDIGAAKMFDRAGQCPPRVGPVHESHQVPPGLRVSVRAEPDAP